MSISDSPHRIALAFSVGVFIGMSPLLGLHTALGIFVAWAFRLNKIVTIVGVYVTNPWTIVPIYSFGTWLGARLLGLDHIIPDIDWKHISMKEFLHSFEPLLGPFAIGTTFLGILSSAISYILIYRSVKRSRG